MDVGDLVHEEEDEAVRLQNLATRLRGIPIVNSIKKKPILTATENEKDKFSRLSEEAQALCVKAIFRLCLFKGSKHDSLTRNQMHDVLSKLDGDYKRHLNAILNQVQIELLDSTGYLLVNGEAIIGSKHIKKDEFFLVNSLSESKQRAARVDLINEQEAAVAGLRFLISHIIISSPGGNARKDDVLRELRRLDIRFPETIGRIKGKSASQSTSLPAIQQLGDSFSELLSRMQKEQYILNTKSDEGDSEQAECLELGPRFYLETGRRVLLLSYFHLLGLPVDENELRETEEDEQENEEMTS